MELTKDLVIAVLMGGPGSEREVSLASGKSVAQALAEAGYQVVPVDVQNPDFELPAKTDLAYNVIHGTFGEDGQLQEILEKKGIPYTGAGKKSSEIAFDKLLSKERFVANGVPTPKAEILKNGLARPVMPVPFVAKPPREGSSVGVHIVKNEGEIADAIADVFRYGDEVLVEEFVQGKELTVGIFKDQALPVIHISPRSGFYDINNKYPWMAQKGGTDYFCPADLSPEITTKVQTAALAAHRSLGIEVYSRVDVLLNEENEAFVLEVNTIPGMTDSSLLPKAAAAVGISFSELCVEIARESLKIERNAKKTKK